MSEADELFLPLVWFLASVRTLFFSVLGLVLLPSSEESPPKSIPKALLDEEWRAAAFAKFDAHVSNKTFQHVDCPADGHKVLRMHPIFSYKYDEHGDIARYKAVCCEWV